MGTAPSAAPSTLDPRLKPAIMLCDGCGSPVHLPQAVVDLLTKHDGKVCHDRGGVGVLLPRKLSITDVEAIKTEMAAITAIPGYAKAEAECMILGIRAAVADDVSEEKKAS